MEIKKFYGKDAKETLEKVRQSLGDDALILSNKPHDVGVEICAIKELVNIDQGIYPLSTKEPSNYNSSELRSMQNEITSMKSLLEEQFSTLVWGSIKEKKPLQAECAKRLLQNGFHDSLVEKIINTLDKIEDLDDAWIFITDLLRKSVYEFTDDITMSGGLHAFWGTSGAGKTTSILKLASLFALNNGAQQIALLSNDTKKIGAIEQLRVYSKIMDMPVRLVEDPSKLQECLKDFSKKKLILIDNYGMSFQDPRIKEQYQIAKSLGLAIKNHLVLPANYQYEVLQEIVKAFTPIGINSVVITKVDEANTLGSVLSVIIENHLPISYITNGQHVPDDIKKITPKALVERTMWFDGNKRVIKEEKLARLFKNIQEK